MKMRLLLAWMLCSGILFVSAQEETAPEEEGTETAKEHVKKKVHQKAKINAPEYKGSSEKLAKIHKAIWDKLAEKDGDKWVKLDDPVVRDGVLDDLKSSVGNGNVKPAQPPLSCDVRLIKTRIREDLKKADKQFQNLEEQEKRYRKSLEEKNPLAQKGDKVKVYYHRGSSTYSYAGVFYGIHGNSIRINSKNIAVMNLTQESKLLLEPKYREEWLEKETARHSALLNNELEYQVGKLSEAERLKLIKKNEELGYIYDVSGEILKELKNRKGNDARKTAAWLTLQEIFDVEWASALKEYQAREAEEKRILEEKKKNQAAENPEKTEGGETPAEAPAEGAPQE